MPNRIRTAIVFDFFIAMNRLLTLFLLLLISLSSNAQSLSVGLRANAAYRLSYLGYGGFNFEEMAGDHLSVVPEVFARYSLKKKWVFEVSFNHSKYSPPDIVGPAYDQAPLVHDTLLFAYKAEYNDLSVSALYELRCPSFEKSRFLKRFHSYAGVTLGLMFSKYESDQYWEGGCGMFVWLPPQIVKFQDKETWFWTGINHNMTFDLGRHVQLVSSAYLNFRPFRLTSISGFHDSNEQAAQFGLKFGAAYRIF